MKFRTVMLFALAFIALWVAYAFFQSENNARILTSYFNLWGLNFKVLNGLLIAMLLAAVLPSIYFTVKYLQLGKQLRHMAKRDAKSTQTTRSLLKTGTLLDHGRYETLLTQLEGNEEPRALLLKGKAHLYSHRAGEAIEPLRQAFFDGESIEAGYLLAKAFRSNGQSDVAVLKAIIERDPQNAHRAYRLLLEAQDKQGLWDDCLRTAAEMKKLGLTVDAMDEVGYQFEAIRTNPDQTPKKALDRYQQLLHNTPQFVPAYIEIGKCHFAMEAPAKALSTWENGFSQTQNPVFLEHLENYYLDQSRPEDAIQIYRKILVRDERPMLRYRLAKLYLKLEMLDECLENFEMLQGQLNAVPGFAGLLGEVYARRELYAEAYRAVAQDEPVGYNDSHVCRGCGSRYESWVARCGHCKQWNQIILEAATVAVEAVPTAPLYY